MIGKKGACIAFFVHQNIGKMGCQSPVNPAHGHIHPFRQTAGVQLPADFVIAQGAHICHLRAKALCRHNCLAGRAAGMLGIVEYVLGHVFLGKILADKHLIHAKMAHRDNFCLP